MIQADLWLCSWAGGQADTQTGAASKNRSSKTASEPKYHTDSQYKQTDTEWWSAGLLMGGSDED